MNTNAILIAGGIALAFTLLSKKKDNLASPTSGWVSLKIDWKSNYNTASDYPGADTKRLSALGDTPANWKSRGWIGGNTEIVEFDAGSDAMLNIVKNMLLSHKEVTISVSNYMAK